MVATLKRLLVSETGLLEQVDDHVGSGKLASRVEVDPDKLSKPGRVVVPHSFGVSPRLKDGVGQVGVLALSFMSLIAPK